MDILCKYCDTTKDSTMFSKDKNRKNGLSIYCKECKGKIKNSWSKTRYGVVSNIYNDQKNNSKRRGHSSPKYTKEELYEWMIKNNFENFYIQWVNSGYKKDFRPSIDRLDDFKPYSLDNIRLTIWLENKRKKYNDFKNGTGTSGMSKCKKINQLSLDGKIIRTFVSARQASRELGINYKNISNACIGNLKTFKGYKWEFNHD